MITGGAMINIEMSGAGIKENDFKPVSKLNSCIDSATNSNSAINHHRVNTQ
jgi:hypothetical protein